MKYFIEAWKAKQAWLDLSQEERSVYIGQLSAPIQQLMDAGTEIVTWGVNDADTDNRLDYGYFAVWRFPDDELARTFQNAVTEAGWYNYFDQVNMKGNAATPADVFAALIGL